MRTVFRQLPENPDIAQAVEEIKKAQIFLDALRDSARQVKHSEFQRDMIVLISLNNYCPDVEHLYSVHDQNYAALWTSLNETHALLVRAGFDVNPKITWGDKQDTAAPARDINRLKALLPWADFSVTVDNEVADYIASQRRSGWFWPLVIIIVLAIPTFIVWLALNR